MKIYIISLLAVLLSVTLSASSPKAKEKVDLVVFSFNRPMQLYAFLESSERYLANVNKTHVIIRSSDPAYTKGYTIVASRFPDVLMHYQGREAPKDFKPLVLKTAFNKKSLARFIMFAVDDMIMTERVDLLQCTKAIKEHPEAWFFSLRLGKNITFCGRLNRDQKVPKGKDLADKLFLWKFNDVKTPGDWDYPNSTDLAIYRKSDIKHFFAKTDFDNPNILEGKWWTLKPKRKQGLSFFHSKAINIPLNVVNPYFSSPNMGIQAPKLLDHFMNGYKIDIRQFAGVNNPSPHVDYMPLFISRG